MTRHYIKIQKQKLDTQNIHSRKNFNTVMQRYKRNTRIQRLSNLVAVSGTLLIILFTVFFLINISPGKQVKKSAGIMLIDSLPVIPPVEEADVLPPIPVAKVNNQSSPNNVPYLAEKKVNKVKEKVDNTPAIDIYQQESLVETATSAEVLQVVEQQPVPIGGMDVFNEYIRKNLRYPEEARKKEIQGKVYIGFVVNTDSTLTDLLILKGLVKACDEEALRVVSESTIKWIPGRQSGKAVRVNMIWPIEFRNEGTATATNKSHIFTPHKPS